MLINIDSVVKSLSHINLDRIALSCKFIQRKSSKVSPIAFLLSQLKSVSSGDTSFAALARFLSSSQEVSISRQAMHKKVNKYAVKFLSKVIQKITSSQQNHPLFGSAKNPFNRILIEDCSVLKVHKSNQKLFPGNGNGKHETAGGKLHQILDWSNAKTIHSSIHNAREADQSLNETIDRYLQEGDLILRDMGFFKLANIQKFINKKVNWISRLPASIIAREVESCIDLNHFLKTTNKNQFDMLFKLGSRSPVVCRIVATKLPKETVAANIRKRKLDAKRRGSTPKKESFIRDRWSIICTNVEHDLSAQQVQSLYQIRWNIEIQFRGIKQATRIQDSTGRRMNKNHLKCIFLSIVIYQLLSFQWMGKIGRTLSKELLCRISYEKICKLLSNHLFNLTCNRMEWSTKLDVRHILQDKRKRQTSHFKSLTTLG